MPARLLSPADYRRVPWKNGLGTTLEIATDAAKPGGPWTWRLSLADVPSRAPFSRFPGIDRRLAVLDGAGMKVDRATEGTVERIAVPREGLALAFAGEDDIVGEPLGPGVRDANLMLDRRCWTGSLEVLRIGAAREISIVADIALVHVHGRPESVLFRFGDESSRLDADSTLVSTDALSITAAGATLVVAQIARRIGPS